MIKISEISVGDYVCFNEYANLVNESLRWLPILIQQVGLDYLRLEIPKGSEKRIILVNRNRFITLSHAGLNNAAYKHHLKSNKGADLNGT